MKICIKWIKICSFLKVKLDILFGGDMKHKLLIVIIGVFTLQIFMLAKVDKYSSGKIIIKKELEITDKKLPDDIILENPISLALNSNGDIFICDFKANNIKKFDKNGNYLWFISHLVGKSLNDFQ